MKANEIGTLVIGGIALLVLHGLTKKEPCCGECGGERSEELSGLSRTSGRPSRWAECRGGRYFHCELLWDGRTHCVEIRDWKCKGSGMIEVL